MEIQKISQKRIDEVDPESKDVLHQTLSMAYYNLAVEYEHCKEYNSATEAFVKAQYFTKLTKNPNKRQFLDQIDESIDQLHEVSQNKDGLL